MKKVGIILTIVSVTITTLFMTGAFATDLNVLETGWDSVGSNEVFLDTDVINLHTIVNGGGSLQSNGNFSIKENRQYTQEERDNGTFDNERDTALTYELIPGYALVYENTLTAGTNQIPGTITLKWNNGAFLRTGELCDVTMTISNITVKNERNTTRPIALLLSGDDKKLEASIFYAAQEVDGSHNPPVGIGAKYDVNISVTKAGTNEKVNNKMIFALEDMDVGDRSDTAAYTINGIYTNSNGTIAEYAEGVNFISGVEDNIYLKNGHYLNYENSGNGSNTNFAGTRVIPNEVDGHPNTEEMRKAGLMTRVNAGDFTFSWHGSYCRTAIGSSINSVVKTSTSGTYANKLTITPTDNEVFWKENKKIDIKVDPGYKLSKVTVDNSEVDINTAVHSTTCPSGSAAGSRCYYYTFNSVISDHEIDVQADRQPYTLTVHHYKDGTTESLGSDVTETKYYGDSYTTSALTNLPAGYELVGVPDNASGTMPADNVTVIYFYKLKDLTLTVHHYEEGTTTKLAPDEVSTKTYGTSYTTDWKDITNYDHASRSDNYEGTITSNTIVNYYYRKKQGTVTVHHYIDGTTTKLAPDESNTYNYGEEYTTSASTSIPQNYVLKARSDNYAGTVSEPNTTVIYYYQKKDSNIVPEISKAGTVKITDPSQTVSYNVTYRANFTDLIGDGTVTIVDTLPYKIDTSNSNLDGGTYDETNKTITWTQNVLVNSYTEPTLTIEKNISVKYLNVDTNQDQMVNSVTGRIVVDDKDIPTTGTFITLIDVKGDIKVKYIDKETGQSLLPDIDTTDKVGKSYTPVEKEIEGYKLVTRPEHTSYEYKMTPQTLVYEYEKIKLNILTKVDGEGGTIEGDEIVPYGNDSTVDKIKMKADSGYVIEKVTINGQEVGIAENLESLTLSNFVKMTDDKLVVVKYKAKPLIVDVEKTSANTPLIITILGIVFIISAAIVTYLFRIGKLDNILKKIKKA